MHKTLGKLVFALSLLFSSGYAIAGQPNSENVRYDKAGWLNPDRTYAVRITSSGHIFGENASVNRLGDSTYPWGSILVGSGVLNVKDYFSDIPTASSSTYKAQGFSISTTTLLSAGTAFIAADFTANGDVPRNIVLIGTYVADSGSFSATASIIGVNSLGLPDTETIFFTTNSTAGNVAWSKVNSISVSVSSVSAAVSTGLIFVGTGNKIGLSNYIKDFSYIYKLLEAGANVVPTSTIYNGTYNTITFNSSPNGSRDYDVWYHAERSPLLSRQ